MPHSVRTLDTSDADQQTSRRQVSCPHVLSRAFDRQVGGFLCLHIDDLREVVPLWINFTVQMRKNPQRYWQVDGAGEDFPTGAPCAPCLLLLC